MFFSRLLFCQQTHGFGGQLLFDDRGIETLLGIQLQL